MRSAYLHAAKSQEAVAQNTTESQAWNIAGSLLYDHAPTDVARLLMALSNAESGDQRRAAFKRVSETVGRWV